MEPSASLTDVVTACLAHEATRRTTTTISEPNQHVHALSTYKLQQKKNQGNKESPTPPTAPACQRRAHHHELKQCPAFKSTCQNCGRQGHRSLTPKCPSSKVQCRICTRMGHFEKYCRRSKPGVSSGNSTTNNKPRDTKSINCQHVYCYHLRHSRPHTRCGL